MTFVFECAGQVGGAELDDLTAMYAAQLVAAAARGLGVTGASPGEVGAAFLAREDEELVVEVWNAFPGASDTAAATLIYFPYVDGGVLFRAGTTDATHLLWPHGFEAIATGPDAIGPALTAAYTAARRS